MEESIGLLSFFFWEFIIYGICYFTGWILLKILSFGKLSIEPRRSKRKENLKPTKLGTTYTFSDSWTMWIGVGFWVAVSIVVAILKQTT
ncbi:hypothetical protein QEH52_11940 [Coraliomargarita sp. SDUM461003]|uniref:Uncharacterized protein n=1 Tax=Thalassobacterium maritimum TaxID=3041265 RepID=A0ABU1AYA8_9BACT|nr:hypothetical protein [Coraliomargarita sp. SDUM461003]MDQ8208224.1 hypothetical protein [Coraliomargarita sp. SDUM461003]